MNKKIILLMAAVIIALICISPIMASDDGFSVQNFLKFGDDTPSLEFEDLHILAINSKEEVYSSVRRQDRIRRNGEFSYQI